MRERGTSHTRLFTIVSGGTDNHSMWVDAHKYPDLTGKVAKHWYLPAHRQQDTVPFDTRSDSRPPVSVWTAMAAPKKTYAEIAEMIETVLRM